MLNFNFYNGARLVPGGSSGLRQKAEESEIPFRKHRDDLTFYPGPLVKPPGTDRAQFSEFFVPLVKVMSL